MSGTVDASSMDANRGAPSRLRRSWRWLRWVFLLIPIFVLLAPLLTRISVVRRSLLGFITQSIQGRLDAAELRAGWWQSTYLRDLIFSAPENRSVLRVPKFEGESTLTELVFHPATLGTWRAIDPVLELEVRGDGTNLGDALQLTSDGKPGGLKRFLMVREGRLQVVRGSMSFQHAVQGIPWKLGSLNLTIDSVPATSNTPAILRIEPGKLVDHMQVTPEVTNDVLKFFAPILAEATRINGEFSVESNSWEIPWDNFLGLNGAGILNLHRVELSPGPIISELAKIVGIDPSIHLVEECSVNYTIQEGVIEHEGLEFHLGPIEVHSSGRVWMDEQIQLKMRVKFPDEPIREGPLAQRLAGKELRIPIQGSLQHPRIDLLGMREENQGNWPIMEGLMAGTEGVKHLVEDVRQRISERSTGDDKVKAPLLPGPLGDRLRARLRQLRESLDDKPAEPVERPDGEGGEAAVGEQRHE